MRLVFALLAALLTVPLITPAAEAQDAYRIRPGDVLRIEVLEDPALNRSALVSPDGRITMALAGVFPVAGRSVEDVQGDLVRRLAENFATTPNVFVSLERVAEMQAPLRGGPVAARPLGIFVMGEAGRPGRLELAPGTTLLQAFAQMGGFSKFAATKRIQLRRIDPRAGTETIYTFNYDAMVRGENASGTTVLADGDVILVPQRGLFE